MSLETALEQLQNAQAEAALASLLEAWRASGDPRTADAVDRLSERLTASEPPIVAVGGTSAKKAWYAAAEAKRPASLGRLIEALPDALDRVKRLEALLAWPPDPRVGTAARRWIEAPPVHGKNRHGFFKTLWTLIEYTRDSRLAPLVASIGSAPSRSTSIHQYGLRSWTALVELAAGYEKLPGPKKANATVLERIEALLAASPTSTANETSANEAELFDRIYADPSDDEARAVLADLLQQRGDPRGEFIALQLARHGTDKPRTPREKKLEQQWGRAWLGSLDDVLLKDGVEYERGFLARCRYAGGRIDNPSLGAREWSTVTHVDLSRASRFVSGSADILMTPELRHLRHVAGLSPDDLPKLEAREELPWETLGWRAWSWDQLARVREGAGKRFAAVRTLIIEGAERGVLPTPRTGLVAILEAWPNVDVLEADAESSHLPVVFASARGKRLTRLVLTSLPMKVKLAGTKLTVALRHVTPPVVAETVRLMQIVAPRDLVVYVDPKGALRDGHMLHARFAEVSAQPIIDAARDAGIPLDLHGRKFPSG